MIILEHLEKKYANATLLADVNAVINDSEVISIIGPSGTGKSTLIRCINMLERPTGGKIILDGENIRALYNGEKYDPAESEDDISYKVLCGACNSMSYHYDPEAEYANTVRVLM